MQKTVYQANDDGLFLYETVANELALTPGSFNIPYGAFEDAPPATTSQQTKARTAHKVM